MLELTAESLEDGWYRVYVSGVYVSSVKNDMLAYKVVDVVIDSLDYCIKQNISDLVTDSYKFRKQLLIEWVNHGNYEKLAQKQLSELEQ